MPAADGARHCAAVRAAFIHGYHWRNLAREESETCRHERGSWHAVHHSLAVKACAVFFSRKKRQDNKNSALIMTCRFQGHGLWLPIDVVWLACSPCMSVSCRLFASALRAGHKAQTALCAHGAMTISISSYRSDLACWLAPVAWLYFSAHFHSVATQWLLLPSMSSEHVLNAANAEWQPKSGKIRTK